MNVKNNKENMLNMSIYLGKVIVVWVKKCLAYLHLKFSKFCLNFN